LALEESEPVFPVAVCGRLGSYVAGDRVVFGVVVVEKEQSIVVGFEWMVCGSFKDCGGGISWWRDVCRWVIAG
jgi:hypothetical protein